MQTQLLNLNSLDYIRVGACAPRVHIGDVESNVNEIIVMARKCAAEGVRIAVFPELGVTGYTCADLFHQQALLDQTVCGIMRIMRECADLPMLLVVGAPVRHRGILYNCAVVIGGGRVIAIVPKTYLPNYNEFYEKRWFASAPLGEVVHDENYDAPFGVNQLIDVDSVKVGIELCEDLWAPLPPSTSAALAGAEIILNLSASNDIIGKYNYLTKLVTQQSARCICAYVYAAAGFGESSTDLVFDGKGIIAECGRILVSMPRWKRKSSYVIGDIDLAAIRRDRLHIMTFSDNSCRNTNSVYMVSHCAIPEAIPVNGLCRNIEPYPFVPQDDRMIDDRCEEIFNIQISGLAQRLNATNTKSLIIGISGGLDSTLALLVAVRTFDVLGIDRKGIIGVTMPGFGTTDRTHDNAVKLMELLGISMREISIVPSVMQHFSDIGHDPSVKDVTYENSQARQRTLLLMDIANQTCGMVLGTGDLSELALGWATYNGDHMSMYGVNAGVPKTLVKYLVKWCALTSDNEKIRNILLDIVDTPISPELIPAKSDGTIRQKTEDLVGPYELHDFFLYYMLRYGFTRTRIRFMACEAFKDIYDNEVIDKWLDIFYRRFRMQQFKRSCLPDGPKIGSVCLSPRGDWRMPSDAMKID